MHYSYACKITVTFLFIINKCEQLQIVCVQSLARSVIGFFVMFKCAPMHYACRKHVLRILIFLSFPINACITNKCALLENVCGHSVVQCVIGFLLCLNARQCTALAVTNFNKFLSSSLLSINECYYTTFTVKVFYDHLSSSLLRLNAHYLNTLTDNVFPVSPVSFSIRYRPICYD